MDLMKHDWGRLASIRFQTTHTASTALGARGGAMFLPRRGGLIGNDTPFGLAGFAKPMFDLAGVWPSGVLALKLQTF